MKKILLLSTALLLSFSSIWAQCTIISNASQTTSLTGGVTSATEFSVAWNPVNQRYYSTISGSGAALMTYNNAGSLVSTVYPSGVYNCGIWWNNNLGQLETNGYSSTGLFTISTNSSGNALGSATNIYTGYNQPATYAQGDYDYDANEVIYKAGSTIYRYNRTNGTQIGTVTLSGTTLTSLNYYFVGYTGCSGKEYVVYDYQTHRALFFSKSTGNYVGFSQLPTTSTAQTTYGVSYANNKIFIHNGTSWLGYDVIQTGISTSSISGPFCSGSSVSVNYTTDTITFLSGNVFTAQLSNASGSFSSPTNIGTVTSTTASTISATIPTNTPFGSNYRIRVISSSPAYTGSDNGTNIIINLPALELGAGQNLCSGSSIQLNGPTGATSYSWSNGSNTQNINVSNPGTYSLTISNSVCSDADTVVVTGITPVVPSLPDTTSTCFGGSTNISAATTGISSYAWSTGSTSSNISPNTSGYYVVTTTDNNNCSAVDSSFLSIVNPTITPGDTSICLGESIELAALGNDCYFQLSSMSTSTGTGSATINTSSSYYHGGIAVDDDYVYVPTEYNTTRYDKQTGATSVYSDRDGLFSDLATGQLYTFWNTNYSDFYYTSSRTSNINAIKLLDQSLNLGTTINLSQTIVGSSGAIIFAGNGFVGLYSAYSDELYKIDLATGNVETLATNLVLYYSGTNNWAAWGVAQCDGNNEYSFLYRYSSYIYKYSTSTSSVSVDYGITNSATLNGTWGSFTYSASDSRWYYQYYYYGEGSAQYIYTGLGWGNASINGYSGSTSSTVTHAWNTGASTIGITVSPTTATNYSVIVSDGISTCYDTVSIGVNALPTISIADTVSACNVDSTIISGPSGSSAYLWSNGSTSQNTYFTHSGSEWLKVTNSNGCSATDTVLVSIVDARLNIPDTTVCSADSILLYPANSVCGLSLQTVTSNNVSSRPTYDDDLGGIAVTQNYIYYNASGGLYRFDANNISSGTMTDLNIRRDGIFSDLSNGQLYTLWQTGTSDFYYNNSSVNAIRKMDVNGNYTSTLTLSESISWSPSCCYYNGIFAGEGFVILWTDWNNTFYKIDLSDGEVTTLGTYSLSVYSSDIYNFWGVAECDGDSYSVVARFSSYIYRFDIETSTYTQLLSNTLGSSAMFAYSPWKEKWYGYSEASFYLGSPLVATESLFEADGSDLYYGNAISNLSFTWSNGDTTSYLYVSPDSNTTYTVTVTDGITSCYDTVAFTVIQSPEVTTTQTDVLCNSDSTGAIDLSVSGGVSPYTYLWSNGSENDSISGLTAGTYSVSVTGANACVVPIEFTLTEPTAIASTLTQTQSASCFEATDGGAYVVASGGVGPYTYLWESGETTDTASALNGDFNLITISDANACNWIDSIDITSPQAIPSAGPLTTSNGFICPGNSTTITAVNGSNGTGTSTFTTSTGEQYFTTSYQTIYFNNISVPNNILGNATITVHYYGDRSISSEYIYLYGENSYNLGATTSMSYNYCNAWTTQSFTVSQSLMQSWISDGSLQMALYNYGGDYCSSTLSYGKAYIEISYATSNERTYWFESACQTDTSLAIGSGPSVSVSPTSTRKYFSINYLDGCYSTCDSITITVAPSFGLNFTVANNPICAGGSTSIIVSGAANNNYSWSPSSSLSTSTGNSVTATPASTQPYSVQYTDFFGCTQYDTVTVDVYPEPILNVLSISNATCNTTNDGYAAVFGSNGQTPYAYSWPSGTTNALAFNLYAGSYVVSVTDANGCTDTTEVNIGVNVDVTITNTSTDPSCNGSSDGSISVTATGGSGPYSMSWSTGANTSNVTGLSAGTYTVTVTDNNGCYDSLVVTLNDPVLLTANIDSVTAQSCAEANNGAIWASGQGGDGVYSYTWSNGATTASNSGIAAGAYTVTITDGGGCTATNDTTLNLVSSNLAAAIAQVQSLTCFGTSEAILAGSGTGGTGTLTYTWSNSSTNDTIYNIGAGNYILTVNDAVGCIDTAAFEVINPAAMTISLTTNDVACNGGATGSINTSISGGTTPYTYAWSNSATTSSLTGLSADSYTITVTDANGCSQSETATIAEPAALDITSVNITPSACAGGSNATIAISINGGTTPYTYAWSNGQSTSTATNLNSGSYTVTATDANGCAIDSTIAIAPTVNPISITLSTTNAACFGSSTGEISATVSGNTGPYTYSWSNGNTTSTISNLAAGTYNLTVTNTSGCTNTATTSLTQPTQLVASITNTVDQSCSEANNGTATVSANGGTSPYTYAWPNGATTETVTGLAAGNYVATVTDANNCSSTATATINLLPSNLTASISLINNVSCNGQSNGALTGAGTGGNGALSLTWSTGANTDTITSLSAGAYNLIVNDTAGCADTTSITITQPNALNLSLSNTPVVCNSTSTGTISSNRTGGTTPYSYQWNTGATTSSLASAAAGTYTLTVTDANGCTISASSTVTQPTAIAVSNVQTTQTTCAGGNDGALSVSIGGGTTPLTYAWSNGATSLAQTGLSAGSYTITVTDGNGCTKTSEVVIQPTDSVDLNLTIANVTCFGSHDGIIVSSPQDGTAPYTFAWGNGSTTSARVNLDGGFYPLTVTDANGCFTSQNIEITEATQPIVISNAVSTDVDCFGDSTGTASLNVSGGITPYSYTWSNGMTSGNPTNLTAGTYQITIEDFNGCIGYDTVSISENPEIIISSLVGTDVTCYGGNDGSATVTAAGGVGSISYSWSNGNTGNAATNLTSDTFTISVTDGLGCLVSNEIFIEQPDSFNVQSVLTNIACNSSSTGSINLTVTGNTAPYTYTWSNSVSAANNSNIPAGTYTVQIEDANACSTSATYTLSQPDSISITLDSTDGILCNGDATGAVYISVNGGVSPYTYAWSNTSQTTQDITSLDGGVYEVSVTDSNSCIKTMSVTIAEPAALSITVDSVMNVSCNGAADGSGFTSVSGGTTPNTFAWSNTSQTTEDISGLTPGAYEVTVSDANGCTDVTQITITEPATLVASMVSSSNANCFGSTDGEIVAIGNGGTTPYAYSWSNGASTANNSNIGAGTYGVTITDANGCNSSGSYSITEPTLLGAMVVNVDSVSCYELADGTVEVSANGGTTPYAYAWSAGTANELNTGLSANTYTVTISDANGCDTILTATVDQPDSISITVSGTDLLCFEDSTGTASAMATGGTGTLNYNWSNGDNTAAITSLLSGTFTVTVTDVNGCMNDESIVLNQPNMLVTTTTIMAEPLCFGDLSGSIEATSTGGTLPYQLMWSNGDTTTSISNVAAGAYMLTVTDANGCMISVSDTVTQPDALSLTFDITDALCNYDTNGALTANASGGTMPWTYAWTTGDTNANISNLATGTYGINIMDANGCVIEDSATVGFSSQSIALNLADSAVVCKPFSIALDAGVDASSYLWSTGDTTQTITVYNGGIYQLVVSNADGCLSADSTFVIEQTCVGIDEVADNMSVELYPNPNRGEFIVNFNNVKSDRVFVTFTSLDGKVVRDTFIPISSNTVTESFNLNGVSQGIYFMTIKTDKEMITKRVIIE